MSLDKENFDFLRDLLSAKAGIVLGNDKGYLAESRLAPLARAYTEGSLNTLIERLKDTAEHGLRQEVLEAMVINETFFYRDPALMKCLEKNLLPDLIHKRTGEQTLRIWSAACSTGQEAWTLCLMLRQNFPELRDWDIQVLASDLSRSALQRARAARYSLTDVNRGMPARMLVSWFEQDGRDWRVRQELRQMVSFREINLVGEWPDLPVFDLILLRNVLIYFDDVTRQQVLKRVRGRLAEDGFLVLGGTERAAPDHGFVQGGHCRSLPCYQPIQ